MFNPFKPFKLFEIGGSGSGSFPITNCWDPLETLTDGGYGFDRAQAAPGNLNPDITSNAVSIYSNKFYDNGMFIIQFGDLGNLQIDNVKEVLLGIDTLPDPSFVILTWDDVNTQYSGTNANVSTEALEYLGVKLCMSALALPITVIEYDFKDLL